MSFRCAVPCLLLFLLASVPTFAAPLPASPQTLAVAIVVDRDGASVTGTDVKPRPYRNPRLPDPLGWVRGRPLQIEVVLQGAAGVVATVRVERLGICFEHDATTPAHIVEDRVELHQESLVLELPAVSGADRIDVAWYDEGGSRRVIGSALSLTALPDTPGDVHWPEEYGDPDIYTVYGSEPEVARRINVVIVPDGYVYAEKALMQSHAQQMVDWFRNKTPYAEHDPFLNYILVYAYSTESTTDECDCSVVKDTAMRTRFPDLGSGCGSSDHRCLYYGTGNGGPNCDPITSSTNISAAELRAPADDTTIVMVNTTRYGGCGGARAVYSAANSAAVEVAVHELGHSLGYLADEYAYSAGCGGNAGEINTSTDGTNGAWAEWIGDLGAPREGAEYYQSCIYRPENNCEMRALNVPFCAVCNQQWALRIFGHPRVAPTAPVESQSPTSPLTVPTGVPVTFSVATRLSNGTTNALTWTVTPPGTVVATGVDTYAHTFPSAGSYTVACEVVADTNFVKPARYGSNREVATWSVTATGGGCGTITLAPATLPGGTVGQAYSQTITASGGVSPYTFAVSAGTLPAGLSLDAAGLLSGTPTAAGSSSFTVTATDAASCTGSQAYTVAITDPSCPAITITPATLPAATLGVAYSQALAASGGTAPYTFALASGTLPQGLALSTAGLLSGTPTTSGPYAFSVSATDAAACTGTASYALSLAEVHVAGRGFGQPNANQVRLFDGAGAPLPADFFAYGAGTWGVNVAAGELDVPAAEILTGPGPGAVFGPQTRAFRGNGTPLAKVNYYAYGTLRYGVNVAGADADGDGIDEILNGPGEGAVFGPHVRAFDVDGGAATAISKVSYFAYGTLRYGVLVEAGDVEADAFAEILTAPGPGQIFGPQVRGFDWDGDTVVAIAKINFNAFSLAGYGAAVAGGDVDADAFAEIAAAAGPGPGHPASFAGFGYDGSAVAPLAGFTDTPFGTLYGARVALGDVSDGGTVGADGAADLVQGAGRDPSATSDVLGKSYDGTTLVPLPGTFTPFAGAGYGVNVGAGSIGS